MYIKRRFVSELETRLKNPKPFIQVVSGPRQVGKTTGIRSLFDEGLRGHYASADLTSPPGPDWIIEQWQVALSKGSGATLVLDEVQKVQRWADTLKALFDETRRQLPLNVIILGSASLSLQRGLSESLAGRFEIVPVPHWSYAECHSAFNWDWDTYLKFGGYPGGDTLIEDPVRWQTFMHNSIIEPVISKDIFSLARIGRPALFRQVLELALQYPGQEISYQKMQGQLQDQGALETIKTYLEILEAAYLVKSLQKFSTRPISTRGSSPKLIPLCPALLHSLKSPQDVIDDPGWRGHVIESVVGAHLAAIPQTTLRYWRDGRNEVDFILQRGREVIGIEVKSGGKRRPSGVRAFLAAFRNTRVLILDEKRAEQLLLSPGPEEAYKWLSTMAVKATGL